MLSLFGETWSFFHFTNRQLMKLAFLAVHLYVPPFILLGYGFSLPNVYANCWRVAGTSIIFGLSLAFSNRDRRY